MLDPRLVEEVADRLRADKSLVEKDWHVVRAIGVLAALDHGDATPVFSGGTSLSKGWGIIKRFSEDIDFKVGMPAAASRSKGRGRRKAYRDLVQPPPYLEQAFECGFHVIECARTSFLPIMAIASAYL